MSTVGAVLERTGSALRDAAGEARGAWGGAAWLVAAALVVAALLPLALDDALRLAHLTEWLTFALAAVGLGLAVGIGGLPSLSQGAFVAIGAFAAALLQSRAGWPAPAAAVAALGAAGLGGIVTGLGVVRLRPVFVAVATWLLAWLVAVALPAFPRVSGGVEGIVVPDPGVPVWALYEVALALLAVALGLFALFARGLPGLALAAVRQRPAGAVALGVPKAHVRLVAFTLAAALGGLAGALEVQVAGVADPASYDPVLSFELLAAVVLGGAATALGGVAGTAVVALAGVLAGALTAVGALPTERFAPVVTAVLVFAALSIGGGGIVPAVLDRRRPRDAPRPAARPAAAARAPTALRAEGVAKRFGELVALDGFAIDVEPGRVTALVGPNGSGKTTALRVLAGTIAPDAGRVSLGDADLTGLGVRPHVEAGVVRTLQAGAVFTELTALENVLVGGGVRRRHSGVARTLLSTPSSRADGAAARVDALARLDDVGIAHRAHARAGDLSALEQRLLVLATASASRPRALLLDEPAAGAAGRELDRVLAVLRRLRDDGAAVLVVEHDFGLVRRIADHVVVLDAGRIVASGPPQAVGSDPAVRAAFLGRRD